MYYSIAMTPSLSELTSPYGMLPNMLVLVLSWSSTGLNPPAKISFDLSEGTSYPPSLFLSYYFLHSEHKGLLMLLI